MNEACGGIDARKEVNHSKEEVLTCCNNNNWFDEIIKPLVYKCVICSCFNVSLMNEYCSCIEVMKMNNKKYFLL